MTISTPRDDSIETLDAEDDDRGLGVWRRNANLPNLLTLFRIAVIPAMVAGFYLETKMGVWLAGGLFLVASVTDFLDGYIARARDQHSALGQFLDPIADKLLVASALLMMVGFGQIAGFAIVPALVILCREILISGLREFLAGLHARLPVSQLAKWKTTIQMVAIALLLLGDMAGESARLRELGEFGLWIAALFTILTAYDYFRASLIHFERDPDSHRRHDGAAKSTSSPDQISD
jgi:cardiolipin synthase (CMP-forming)